ncbi:hypothetical protein PSA7680_01435 [Pseudoruegeria aquimaris]|uniref:DUF3429 domain-containing protein n=1 Tax=Pseudoruegeria aquimaris TaxID=393663 RepID=A0A1Y5S0Z7_9RHOB|nr:DUF3429 domain-containing protein [Pseudoruegeria aquimaris]SLN30181.1 hypothetical protein PSA7680_01435 [Pseudoruegeria aquimaris]
MSTIPRAALILGLAGVLPFAWGALSHLLPDLTGPLRGLLPARFSGVAVMISYGIVILAFMSGVLWGFAAQTAGRIATVGYVLSVLPALWAFFLVGSGLMAPLVALMVGFAVLLLFDGWFWWRTLAPRWWMWLRILLTGLVLLCLYVGVSF